VGTPIAKQYPHRVSLEIRNGIVLIGSDFHIWPETTSTCLRAFKKFVKDLRPDAVVLNGDVMDFPRISRHPQNWETAPDPAAEIEAAQDHLNDIEMACKRGAHKIWPIGNHDQRLEALIANSLPQLRGMKGVHLSDFFPTWRKAMSCFINERFDGGVTVIKHKPVGGGKYATRNYVERAGIHAVHGHFHRQGIVTVSDYNEYDRYGVDAGCVADKDHCAFLYTQDAPLDWRSGFVLLTYRNGRLMSPELITKWDDKSVQFRGEIIQV